ncbi:MAG: hypothetical protein E7213_04225 [Clostridium sp.]|nr:hypothetical protein [Clostridium sp.]
MIKVDIENLKGELEKLSSEMVDFEPYSSNFIKNTTNNLDEFNSDFISEIKKALSNMTDTKAPKLMKNMQDFYTSLDTLLKDFETLDTTIANNEKMEG